MSQIKFGTDGWRAIIDQEFNRENVARVIQAFCDVKKDAANRVVYVGYDRRRYSQDMGRLVAAVLAANGFTVRLSKSFCPTPCVSWLVKANQALAGVIVTASHNPPEWNGIKFKEETGVAASPAYTSQIEARIQANEDAGRVPKKASFDEFLQAKRITYFDPDTSYVKHLGEFVDVKAIQARGYKIAVDPLFGAGTDFVAKTLGANVIQIHDAADPAFGGLSPEPIAKNLGALRELILKEKADIGLATDGDADRIGAFDENGVFVNSHQIFSLLLLHNLRHRGQTGAVVKSVSTTDLIRKICQKFHLELIETPVGFKHISGELLKHNALMGGEESGGISIREHVHERDGVLNGLLLLEMMAVGQKRLSELIAAMDAEFGKFYFARDDYHLTDEKIRAVKELAARESVKEVSGIRLTRFDHLDGTKMYFEDESWLLVRASGTEPLLRVYAEAHSKQRISQLLNFAKKYFEL